MIRACWTYLGVIVGVAGSSPIWLAFGWDAWERLRAVHVPQAEIDRLAADCMAQFGPGVELEIEIQLDRALRRGETGEYWLLRRVLAAIAQDEERPAATLR